VYKRQLLGQPTKISSTGGEFLELREYNQGDDYRLIDANASARSDKLIVKRMNEQKTNTIQLAVDAEWLADDLGNSSPLQNVLTLCYLSLKERIPVNLHFQYRGETVLEYNYEEIKTSLMGSKQAGLQFVASIDAMAQTISNNREHDAREDIDPKNMPLYIDLTSNPWINKKDTIIAIPAAKSRGSIASQVGALKGAGFHAFSMQSHRNFTSRPNQNAQRL
jgi:hypothetical protein